MLGNDDLGGIDHNEINEAIEESLPCDQGDLECEDCEHGWTCGFSKAKNFRSKNEQ